MYNAYLSWDPNPAETSCGSNTDGYSERLTQALGPLGALSLPHQQSGCPERFVDTEGSCSLSSCATGSLALWGTRNRVYGAEIVSLGKVFGDQKPFPGIRESLPGFKPVSHL